MSRLSKKFVFGTFLARCLNDYLRSKEMNHSPIMLAIRVRFGALYLSNNIPK